LERKLQITGKGKLKVVPDIIILSFDVEAHEWEYEKTVNALNAKVEQLRTIIETVGLNREILKTKDFRIRKDTSWNKKTEKSEFNGFIASHNLELELALNKGIINNLLGLIAKSMENLDFKIAFGVKDASPAQQQLILQAIAQAKDNANLIASATGIQLKEILNIDYSFRELIIRSQHHDYPVYEANMLMETSEPTMNFEPDDIEVTETITIIWRIE
jgi:uncharacterized protein